MSLTQRITDLATRIGQEVKLKPSKSANEVISGKWDMAQHGVLIGGALTAPNSGYVGFAAKADGLYQKIGAASDLRLLTTGETDLAKLNLTNTFAEVNTFLKPIISWKSRFGDFPGTGLGAYISQNLVYNTSSAAWELDDINAAGAVATITATSPFMLRSATAGANPRTLSTLLTSDMSGNFTFTGTAQATRLLSTIATGTAPLTVTSTTVVTNLNADMLDGKHSSSFASQSTISATLPAAAGWYRVATSAASINHCSGEFEIEWTLSGVHGIANVNASIMYGQYPSLNMLNYSHYSTSGFTKARIVYHTTYSGNYAYLEVYNTAANAIVVNVTLTKNTGWTLLSPDTAGSIPAGYTNTEITFVDGIATEGQIASFVATGIAPLSVASTTAVTNLNADLLDGNHASAFALTGHTHTGVYQPLHANLTGIAGLPIMPGLVKTDGAGNWSLDTNPYVVGTPWQGEGYIKDSLFSSNGLVTRTGTGTYTITPTNTYQPIDADLTAIAGLTGSVGFLIKTNTNTWSLDTSTYALSTHTHTGAYAPLAGSLTQDFSVKSLYIECGTWDYSVSGANGILSFSDYNGYINFSNGCITSSGVLANTIASFDAANKLIGLDTTTYPSLTELSYLKGITGAINTTYAKVAGSSTQGFNASTIYIEAGTYPFQIQKLGSDLTFVQYGGTAATFNSATGITTPGIILTGETASTLAYFDATKKVKTLPTASYPSLTEIAYVKGVTSAIQTQLAARALLAGSTTQVFSTANLSVTGTVTATSTVKGTYGIFTGLSDNRVPYHVNDTTGLNDSAISADGSNMTINGGKIRLKTLTDPTHHLYNNASDYDAINVSVGFMVEAYNGGTPLPIFTLLAAGTATFTGAITAANFILPSDRRLKQNIESIMNLSHLDTIPLVQFNLKDDPTQRQHYGVIAQDVEEAAPELVYTNEDGMKSIAYIDLLVAKIARLEERIKQMEE